MTHPLIAFLQEHPVWAMAPNTLQQLCGVLTRHLSGATLSAEEIQAVTATRDQDTEPALAIVDDVAVLPIAGVIARHASMVNGSSQPRGTAVETIRTQLHEALDNPQVASILLHVSSPGGNINGVPELADEIAAADREKPVIALADGMAASAAYWLAAPARCVFATQASISGAIGCYIVLVDSSKKYESQGLLVIAVTSGRLKATAIDGTTITPEQIADVQQMVTDMTGLFKAHVVAARPRLAGTIDALATGGVFSAARALDAGLIDAVATYSEAVAYARALADDPDTPLPLSQETSMFGKTDKTSDAAPAVASPEAILQAERGRVSEIMAALPDALGDVRQASIAAGHTVEQAKAAAFDGAIALLDTQAKAHTQALAAEQTKSADAEARLEAVAGAGTDTDKAPPDDADPTPDEQDAAAAKAKAAEDKPLAFEALVAAKVKDNPADKRSEAIRAAMIEQPDLYQAWLEAQGERQTKRLGDPQPAA